MIVELLAAILATVARPPAVGPAADLRASDIIKVDFDLCVNVGADPTRATLELDSKPAVARKLNPARLTVFFGAETASKLSVGWITQTPNDAWLVLAFAPSIRTCSVLVRAVDAVALDQTLRAAVAKFGKERGGKISAVNPKHIDVDGVPATESTWFINPADGSRLSLIANIAERPFAGGAKQALMTFSVLHVAESKSVR